MNLQQATIIARKNTGRLISATVKAGQFRIVEIVKKKGGNCDVIALHGPCTASEAIQFMVKM